VDFGGAVVLVAGDGEQASDCQKQVLYLFHNY
jgi:hypothetical protein